MNEHASYPFSLFFLRTYPLPSLEGNIPSAIKKLLALKWSEITLWLAIVFLLIGDLNNI